MRRARFRLRTLLVAVAVVGILLGGLVWTERMRRRAASFRARAVWHHQHEQLSLRMAARMRQRAARSERFRLEYARRAAIEEEPSRFAALDLHSYTRAARSWAEWKSQAIEWVGKCSRLADYQGRLRQRYQRAATRPWLPVPPDPPPPD